MDDNTVGGIVELHDIEGDDSFKEFPKEDDAKISFNWSKQDGIPDEDHPKFYKEKRLQEDITEEEKNILKFKVRLDDGMLGEAVTCFKRGEDWFYFCHPCLKEVEGWENLKEHESNKEHKVVLSKAAHSRNKFNTKHVNENFTEEITDLDLAPCEIQPKLDEYDKSLIGLEYLVESKIGFKGFGSDPQYYCLLCDKLGNDTNILVHLSSKKHYLKYFLMFFPTALEKLKQFATIHVKMPDLVDAVIDHVAARIETEYGRLVPQQVERDSFDGLKFKILSAIDCGKHIRETKELTFAECVCLTHLHLSVCEVVPYQKKWISEKIKEEEEVINEEVINEEEMEKEEAVEENPKTGKNKKRFKKKSTFASVNRPVFKNKDVSASTSTLIKATDDYFKNNLPASGKFFKKQLWKLGKQQKQGNIKPLMSTSIQDEVGKNNTDKRRDSSDSGYNNMNKRAKGVPYSQPSMSSQNVQPKAWENRRTSNYGAFLKDPRTPSLMNPVVTNAKLPMSNNINVPIATNTMPNNPARPSFLYQNSQITQAVRNFAAEGLKKPVFVQNTTTINIQQKLYQLANPNQMNNPNPSMNQIHSQMQKPNTNQTVSTKNYKTGSTNNYQTFPTNNYQTKPNTNRKPINRTDTGRSNIQSRNVMEQKNFTKSNNSNFQNARNTVQTSLNTNIPTNQMNRAVVFPLGSNVSNPLLLSQNQPNAGTLPTNFNSMQSMVRMPPPALNNSSNAQQLNPVAFNNRSQFMTIPAPQRFNLPTSNQFKQQMNNYRKY